MPFSTVSTAILVALLFVSSTLGHSQMRCAKYNTQTDECYAPIRNSEVSFESEAYDMVANGGLCQQPMTNPITASYSNGAGCPDYAPCPAPMGTYTPGETFYIQWLARNHATPDQTPGNISLYLSPVESVNQGADVSAATFAQNKICTAPFMSCNGLNGNFVNCSAPCTMPSNTAPGIYTLWWKWAWTGHTSVYSTCADIYVVSGGSNTPVPVPVPQPAAPTPAAPSTTGKAQPSTTGAQSKPAPTPAAPTPTPAPVPTPVPTPTPTPASPTPSSPSCNKNGIMKCLTSETYSTCNAGNWGVSQSCPTGSVCNRTGDYIYCVKPSTKPSPSPVPTPSAPSTPSSPSAPTPAAPTGSCTMGYQKCIKDDVSNTYVACGNGVNGPTWSSVLSCQAGLTCHPSATANNIYCY